jgi:hypothetical protein
MERSQGEWKHSPWARIVRAADRGTGVRLSPDDVLRLMTDDAIVTRGRMDLEGTDERGDVG